MVQWAVSLKISLQPWVQFSDVQVESTLLSGKCTPQEVLVKSRWIMHANLAVLPAKKQCTWTPAKSTWNMWGKVKSSIKAMNSWELIFIQGKLKARSQTCVTGGGKQMHLWLFWFYWLGNQLCCFSSLLNKNQQCMDAMQHDLEGFKIGITAQMVKPVKTPEGELWFVNKNMSDSEFEMALPCKLAQVLNIDIYHLSLQVTRHLSEPPLNLFYP